MSALLPATVSAPGEAFPTPEEVLHQLETLLSSPQLRESHQLQAFLEYIVKESLAGRQDGLKEYTLGCTVFGRKADYDPRHDGIVRVQATTLRKRLDRYYTEEGAADRVRIELPRGGYVPAFRYHAEPVALAPVPVPVVVPNQPWKPALAGAAVIAFVWLAWTLLHGAPRPYQMNSAKPADFPQLWAPFFEPGSKTMVGFGVPLFYVADGLYLRDVRINAQSQEHDGRLDEFAEKFKLRPIPTDDTYTGVGEMVGTNLLSNFMTANGIPATVTNARTISASDLGDQNLIIVSSLRFQTLLQDLHLPEAFEFVGSTPEVIRDLKPLSTGNKEYVFKTGAGISTSYALVSVWPGPKPGRRILWIGGVHTWATQAATEFVLQPDYLKKMRAEFATDQASGAHGKPSPYFQILLKVEGRGNHSLHVEYVTHHYLPPPS